jgi:hypothetical protein
MKTWLLEVTATVDDEEATDEKESEIRRALESIDPSIAIIIVENILSGPEDAE